MISHLSVIACLIMTTARGTVKSVSRIDTAMSRNAGMRNKNYCR
jgi:hypothetical protein